MGPHQHRGCDGPWQEDGEQHFAAFQLVRCALVGFLAKVAARAVSPYMLHLRNINDLWTYFSLLTLSQVKERQDEMETERSSQKITTYNRGEVLDKAAETAGPCSVSSVCKYYKFLTQCPK